MALQWLVGADSPERTLGQSLPLQGALPACLTHLHPGVLDFLEGDKRPRKLLKAWKGQSRKEGCSFLSIISIY